MIMQVLADLARDGDRGLEDVDLRAVGARHLERRNRRGVGDALPLDRRTFQERINGWRNDPKKLGRHRPLTDDTISTGPLAYSCTSTLDRSMGASDAS